MNIPERIGKYEVQSILGKGAAGIVFRGFDASIQRPVALKVVEKSALDPEELEYTLKRFRTEARAVGRLTHPRIAAIYDFIETEELACIVMELVNGKSLQHHLKDVSRFDLKDAWDIVRQILDGLGYTHGQGVIHRDLKPANVLINDDGRIKITDFGVARIDTSTLTQMGDIVGTPHYMAPEQFAGQECTALTDLYQVGVMTYELLTGRRPFSGNNAEILRAVINERPLDPSEHSAKIAPSLDAAIQRALAKSPKDRFASARDMAEALRIGFEESMGKPVASTTGAFQAATVANLMGKAKLIAGAKAAGAGGADAAGGPASLTTTADLKKARVLFVDDEERILNALRAQFRQKYHVFTAENGALALEFVKRFGMHVVVSDQRMPNMVGVEFLRQVKEMSPNSVRLLLTGYSDLAAIVGSINDGEVFRFIKKPWDNDDVQRTLADAVAIAFELAATPPLPAGATPDYQGAVVVIDPTPELSEALRQLIPASVAVRHVTTADDALKTIEAEEVAVIVADMAAGKEALVPFFELLKATRPEILSILATETHDAELAIELINQAQVFRLLSKPLNTRNLRGYVEMALRRYLAFKASPTLVHQHQVKGTEKAQSSAWGSRLMDRIRALPSRLFSRST